MKKKKKLDGINSELNIAEEKTCELVIHINENF